MAKVMKFDSMEAYEAWTEKFEECYEYENIPVIIDDGWTIRMDIMTDCKSWKTALKRFEKAFGDYDPSIKDWIEGNRESCENGYFGDWCRPAWCATEEELKTFYSFGTFSWGVEEVDEGRWYCFLNISGEYAGRQKKAI